MVPTIAEKIAHLSGLCMYRKPKWTGEGVGRIEFRFVFFAVVVWSLENGNEEKEEKQTKEKKNKKTREKKHITYGFR